MVGPVLTFKPVEDSSWDSVAAGFRDVNLLQTRAFGDAKVATGPWRVERREFCAGEATVGVVQVLIRTLPLGIGGLAWINRGPLWRRSGTADDPTLWTVMTAGLRDEYVRRRGFYLRLAPAIGVGEPMTLPAGVLSAGTSGWASAVVDLTPPPENLRSGLKQKWRNALNKAERVGPEIEDGDDAARFETFCSHYAEWLGDKGFSTSVTPDLLCALRGGLSLRVFLARAGGAVVGSALIVRYADTAEYLAGTTTEEGRRLGAGQVLLWRAMLWARDDGARRFDVGGMDADLTPVGIFRFKSGLGGTPYRLAPEVEALPAGGLCRVSARLVRGRVRAARVEE